MADLSITAANVLPPADARESIGIAGETVTAGMVLYYKVSDGYWYKADALTAEKAGSALYGYLKMAMSGATAGQPVVLAEPGQTITMGAVFSVGRLYVLSATATSGKIAPIADLVNTNYLVPLGYADTTSTIVFNPVSTGIVLA